MTHTKGIAIFAMVASLILVSGTALAQASGEPTGANIDGSTSDSTAYSGTGGTGSVTTTPGVVTAANVTADQSTESWAGLYGNATGDILLADNSDNVLYEWTAEAEYVFASTGSPTWSSLGSSTADALASNVGGVYNDDSSDNATETYNETGITTWAPSGTTTSEGAQTFDGSGAQAWDTALLDTGSPSGLSDFVFAATAQPDSSTTAWDTTQADYQAIVPEDNSGNSYNLYLELQ